MNWSLNDIKLYKPYFLFLLPVFFVLHGYVENNGLVPAADAGILLLEYLAAAALLLLLGRLVIKNFTRTGIFCFFLLLFYFFFGSIHDTLKHYFANTLFTRYSILLTLFFLLFILLFIWMRNTKKTFPKFCSYLNVLMLLLIILETGMLLFSKKEKTANITGLEDVGIGCDSCANPDIYLLIADSYPGQTELNDLFQFDNSAFLEALRSRDFHITDSTTSNYNFTPFSMASMLNMRFLEGITGSNSNKKDIAVCYNTLKQSRVLKFLKKRGYRFYNYSIFDFNNKPSLAKPTFLLRKTTLITAQTLFFRLRRDLGFHLATQLKMEGILKQLRTLDLENNKRLIDRTLETAATNDPDPKFVYTHLVMPHYPYYFDSTGSPVPYELLTDEYAYNKTAFISYLTYANQQLLKLIDQIRTASQKPPVIILMSDHGFREFSEPVDPHYYFTNLNAILLPDSNYQHFYNGMTNINQFRILLNTTFGQQFLLKKDSTSFLNE